MKIKQHISRHMFFLNIGEIIYQNMEPVIRAAFHSLLSLFTL